MVRHILVFLIAILAPTAGAAPQGDKPLKIFMLWDMEGTSGLFTRKQVWYWVQGDEACCREAEGQFPGVVTAVVKRAESTDRAAGLDGEAARRLTARKVAEALEKLRTAKPRPFKPALPMTVSIRMKTVAAAQAAAKKPGVQRVDDFTVQARVERQCDVIQWITGHGPEMPEVQKR